MPLLTLSILLLYPLLHKLLLQLLFARQVELTLAGLDVCVFWEAVLDKRSVFF